MARDDKESELPELSRIAVRGIAVPDMVLMCWLEAGLPINNRQLRLGELHTHRPVKEHARFRRHSSKTHSCSDDTTESMYSDT
jgi:hypothetical protein